MTDLRRLLLDGAGAFLAFLKLIFGSEQHNKGSVFANDSIRFGIRTEKETATKKYLRSGGISK